MSGQHPPIGSLEAQAAPRASAGQAIDALQALLVRIRAVGRPVSVPVAELSGLLAAHNAAASLLEGLGLENLELAAAGRAQALAGIGVERAGARLWLFPDAYRAALAEDQAGVREALLGLRGLLPALRQAALDALDSIADRAGALPSGVAAGYFMAAPQAPPAA